MSDNLERTLNKLYFIYWYFIELNNTIMIVCTYKRIVLLLFNLNFRYCDFLVIFSGEILCIMIRSADMSYF